MFDTTIGPARQQLTDQQVAHLKKTKALVSDERRSRPDFFDGRFLAGIDLTREQNYFLSRQADLGKACGAGVSAGLWVTRGANAFSIQIAAGHGITPSGQLVVLPETLEVNLVNVPEIERLDASFGLSEIPRAPAQNRTGHFVVALRAVQYTASPIASYPTSLSAERSVQDSDIIEAVAITLIPYSDAGARVDAQIRRGRLAHEIFVAFDQRRMPAGVLPIAMIALESGTVAWVDQYLVRREIGAAQAGALDFAFASRALREAHLLQYDQQLSDIMETVGDGRFTATDYFRTLPAVGKLPRAAFDAETFTQVYFPPEVEARLSLIPSDELPALIEESLMLPPIDLTLDAEYLEGVSVNVLVTVPRDTLRELLRAASPNTGFAGVSTIAGLNRRLASSTVIRPRSSTSLSTIFSVGNAVQTQRPGLTDEQWLDVIANNADGTARPSLWYVRVRDLDMQTRVVSLPVAEQPGPDIPGPVVPEPVVPSPVNPDVPGPVGPEPVIPDPVGPILPSLPLDILSDRATNRLRSLAANDRIGPNMLELFNSPTVRESPLLLAGAAMDTLALDARNELTEESLKKVALVYADDQLTSGVAKLTAASPELFKPETVRVLASSGSASRIAALGARLDDPRAEAFANQLSQVAAQGDPTRVTAFVVQAEREIN